MKQESERKKMVLAMEYIARQINNEDIFESWLMIGVGDGDINYGSFDMDEVDEAYIEDDYFREMMECFLRVMRRAAVDGGLYCGKIVTRDEKTA